MLNNTLARNLQTPFIFKAQYLILLKKDEALVNQQGIAMYEEIAANDPRIEALKAFDTLMDKPLDGPVAGRIMPIYFARAVQDAALWNQVAKFNSFDSAKAFMKKHHLTHPKYEIKQENRLKRGHHSSPSAPVTEKTRSKSTDWQRRGMTVPPGYFIGRADLTPFHRKQRLIRDQASAIMRRRGVFKPTPEQIDHLIHLELN